MMPMSPGNPMLLSPCSTYGSHRMAAGEGVRTRRCPPGGRAGIAVTRTGRGDPVAQGGVGRREGAGPGGDLGGVVELWLGDAGAHLEEPRFHLELAGPSAVRHAEHLVEIGGLLTQALGPVPDDAGLGDEGLVDRGGGGGGDRAHWCSLSVSESVN